MEPSYLDPTLRHAVVEHNAEGDCMAICPSIVEVAPGRFVVAYHRTSGVDFHGSYSVWVRFSDDAAETWGGARPVTDNIQAPGLLQLPDGSLLLNGCEHHGNSRGSRSTTMRLFRSRDEGRTWDEQAPVWAHSNGMYLQGGCGNLVRLRSGRILCPLHGAAGDNYSSAFEAWCYYSDDDGANWRESTNKVTAGKRGAMEPCVAQLRDGSLVMALRTQLGAIYLAESNDDGLTWSDARSSGVEAPEAPLAMSACSETDLLVLAYCGAPYEPDHHHSGDRTPLRVAVSRDRGKTWRQVGDIAGGEHEFGASGPNSICFTSGGRVIFAYNWIEIPWCRDRGRAGGTRIAVVPGKWLKNRKPARDRFCLSGGEPKL
jgi:sialidase-1